MSLEKVPEVVDSVGDLVPVLFSQDIWIPVSDAMAHVSIGTLPTCFRTFTVDPTSAWELTRQAVCTLPVSALGTKQGEL
ncbi:MAG TPA: hypothetical protein VGO47_06635 [Chlamydiales bacterium]|nr:hypothetical protein [Chlamydiales bacterium]